MENNNQSFIPCPSSLGWTPSAIRTRHLAIYVCSIALISHAIFWSQFILFSSIRHKSLQWIYVYLITDLLILIRFFIIYSIRVTANACISAKALFLFVCYIELFVDHYLNIVQVYILLALNYCRFLQIVYNRNIYVLRPKSVIMAHFAIYVGTFVGLFFQFYSDWADVLVVPGDSCDARYKYLFVQILNILFCVIVPIASNIGLIIACGRHIRLGTKRRVHQNAQGRLSAREKFNRSLFIQFVFFYSIWLILWLPNVIVYQVTSGRVLLSGLMQLFNFIGIALDPFIISALDVRFWNVWKHVWSVMKNFHFSGRIARASRIRPMPRTAATLVPVFQVGIIQR